MSRFDQLPDEITKNIFKFLPHYYKTATTLLKVNKKWEKLTAEVFNLKFFKENFELNKEKRLVMLKEASLTSWHIREGYRLVQEAFNSLSDWNILAANNLLKRAICECFSWKAWYVYMVFVRAGIFEPEIKLITKEIVADDAELDKIVGYYIEKETQVIKQELIEKYKVTSGLLDKDISLINQKFMCSLTSEVVYWQGAINTHKKNPSLSKEEIDKQEMEVYALDVEYDEEVRINEIKRTPTSCEKLGEFDIEGYLGYKEPNTKLNTAYLNDSAHNEYREYKIPRLF